MKKLSRFVVESFVEAALAEESGDFRQELLGVGDRCQRLRRMVEADMLVAVLAEGGMDLLKSDGGRRAAKVARKNAVAHCHCRSYGSSKKRCRAAP